MATITDLVTLVNGYTEGSVWSFVDQTNNFSDAGTTQITASGLIYQTNDLCSRADHMRMAASAHRPTWNGTSSGASFFGGLAFPDASAATGSAIRTVTPGTSSNVKTFGALINPTSQSPNITLFGPGVGNSGGFLNIYPDGTIEVYCGTSRFTVAGAITFGSWQTIIVTTNAGTATVYVNGTAIALSAAGAVGGIAWQFGTLGNDANANYTSNFYKGLMRAAFWAEGDKTADVATIHAALASVGAAPVFSVNPSISPGSGTAGSTVFTATNGTASNTTGYTRRWLLNGVSIGTGTTVTPSSAGSLVLEVTATGAGGSTIANSSAVTVSAAATSTVRRGGMGLGLGLGFSFGGGGAATANLSWPAGVTPPPLLLPEQGIYAGAAIPLTDNASIRTAVQNAPLGYAVLVSGAALAQLDLSGITRGAGDVVRVRSFDKANPMYINPNYATIGQNGLVDLTGSSGIALLDLKLELTDSGVNFTPFVKLRQSSNCWLQRMKIYGTVNGANGAYYGRALTTTGFGVSNIHVLDCDFKRLNQGFSFLNATGVYAAFNNFQFMGGDPHHHDASWNVSIIGETELDSLDVEADHHDLIQFATSASTTQGNKSIVVALCGGLGNPNGPLDGSGASIARGQGITIQDDTFSGAPFEDILVTDNWIIGSLYNAININKTMPAVWKNIRFPNNKVFHVAGADNIAEARLTINDGGNIVSGSVTGNGASAILTSQATGMTGQIGTFRDSAYNLADYAAGQAKYAEYLALRARYKTLAGL